MALARVLPEHAPIRLQEDELDGYRFVESGDLAGYLPGVPGHPGLRRAGQPGRGRSVVRASARRAMSLVFSGRMRGLTAPRASGLPAG